MKRLFCAIAGAFLCLVAGAQIRSYSDNASGTFIFGLENYFYGRSGSLEFRAGGTTFELTVENGDVYANGAPLEGGRGEVVVGTHDFSGNGIPEVVVARRNNSLVYLTLYRLASGGWVFAGATEPVDGSDMRVFRQVVSVRSGNTLHSWTWRGNGFDYKSNQ